MWYYLKEGDIITSDCFFDWNSFKINNGISISRFTTIIGKPWETYEFVPMRRLITKTPKGNKRYANT